MTHGVTPNPSSAQGVTSAPVPASALTQAQQLQAQAAVSPVMRPYLPLAFALAIVLAGPASARDSALTVSVQVVDRRPATGLLDAIPVPPQARVFDRRVSSRSYAFSGPAAAAAAFYAERMPALGYHALHRHDGASARQLWSDGRSRVRLQIDPALGGELTRIRVDVGLATASAAAPGAPVAAR